MFTGIIEETGKIKSFKKLTNGAELIITADKVLSDAKIGDSICVSGVCQTVKDLSDGSFSVMLSDETLGKTDFINAKQGQTVNLERALTLNTRLGGHIVSGHVDCVGQITSIEKLSEFYNIECKIPEDITKYIASKGSITINGISLTVAKTEGNKFKTAIIPHTYENTNLKELQIGSNVNIETDILAKYVEKLLFCNNNSVKQEIDMEFLKENGFV